MRRLMWVWVVAATTMGMPAWALAGDQEIAQEIANQLRDSGRLSDYTIAVSYLDGTAVLRGSVRSQEQAATAAALAENSPHVTSVVNNLQIESAGGGAVTLRPENSPQRPVARMAAAYQDGVRSSHGAGGAELSMNHGINAQGTQGNSLVRQTAATEGESYGPELQQPAGTSRRTQASPAAALPRRQGAGAIPIAMLAQNGQGVVQPAAPMPGGPMAAGPMPAYVPGVGGGVARASYDQPHMPNYAWPSYAPYPNYSALTYPKQYSPTAWPYIGPFYPYPQVPLGWRKVTLEWDDGWWMLDFKQ